MKYITITSIIARTTSLILIFLFIKNPEHIYRYCFFYSCTFFISGLIGLIICHRKYKLSFQFAKLVQIRRELKDGWFLFLSAAMICIFGNIGITILAYYVDESAVGAYSAINKISYVMNILFLAFSKALYPYISASFAKSKNDGFYRMRKTMFPIVALFSLLSIIIAVLRIPIVEIVFGDEYTSFSFLLVPFVLQVVFAIVNNFIGIQSLVGNGYQKAYCSAITIGMIAIVVLNLIFIQLFDLIGAAFASLTAEIFLTIVLAYKNHKIFKVCIKKSIM